MHCSKKRSKGGLKMEENTVKAVKAHTEAIKYLVKPEAAKPKLSQLQVQRLAFISHPMLGNWICAHRTKSWRFYQPKPKVQIKAEAAAPAQAPKGAQAPVKNL
ncbi:large ribosomal subunit protein eL29-like [Meriones unguiculatus]|uniref:large ribosomal subunit protein eL29-like n=1 Tax=Meriones unguiculatus TaxID=10047 RepID=UPI000B4EC043|nr:large ribosomal subunit protein eL29-like [Meriones unguiculatus]